MTDPSVVIAGAGPTGLMLAAELALAGVDVVIVERRATQQLDGSRAGGVDLRGWADRVQLVDARYRGAWELPVLGAVSAPTAVLIRPDGYVAWAGEGTQAGLREALTAWFGPPN